MPSDQRLPSAFVAGLIQMMVGVLLFISLLNGQHDLTILSVLVFASMIGAKLWSRLSTAKIVCTASADKVRVFPEETFIFDMTLFNGKVLPVWVQLEFPAGAAPGFSGDQSGLTAESGLLWYQKVRFQWQTALRHRGVHQIGRAILRSGDLIGFYPREVRSTSSLEILVYPRLVPLKPFAVPRREFFGVPGAKSPIEDPVFVHGTRDYQHGRPARYIHWKATARHNRLQEKMCEPAEQEKVLLVVDVAGFSSNRSEAEFERCLEAAASLTVRFDRMRYAVGLITNGCLTGGGAPIVPIARSPRQMSDILEVLARVEMQPAGELIDVLSRGVRWSWGVTGILFSRHPDGKIATYLRNRNIPMVSIVSESMPPGTAAGVEPGCRIMRLDDLCFQKGAGE